MPSNAFNASNPTKKPPAYCWYRKDPLPIFFPPIGPARLQGYARVTNLWPIPQPTDIAIYTTMNRLNSTWVWQGGIEKMGYHLWITLSRIVDPQPWQLDVVIYTPWDTWGIYIWSPITMQLEPSWDTGRQQNVDDPGIDFQEARVQQ